MKWNGIVDTWDRVKALFLALLHYVVRSRKYDQIFIWSYLDAEHLQTSTSYYIMSWLQHGPEVTFIKNLSHVTQK